MGYNMVRWGAGVHQWQVTTDQLFHQLYVQFIPSFPLHATNETSGQTWDKLFIVLSALS